jgi:hypothetical protein
LPHPCPTPQAVAREAGGRWCIIPAVICSPLPHCSPIWLLAPAIHPTSSCLWGWGWVLCCHCCCHCCCCCVVVVIVVVIVLLLLYCCHCIVVIVLSSPLSPLYGPWCAHHPPNEQLLVSVGVGALSNAVVIIVILSFPFPSPSPIICRWSPLSLVVHPLLSHPQPTPQAMAC